jgi:hypothetical protein
MSATTNVATRVMAAPYDPHRSHRIRMVILYVLAIAVIVGLAVYGFDYYTLSAAERPFSAKHALLKPSGKIGLRLGFVGFGMFLAIFLYPLRKRWAWLSRQGSSKRWLDIHVLLGLSAPFVIAFHSSFKFQGFAGMAFWIMVAVSASGIIGRYVYAQIPRNLNTAELSLKELQELQDRLSQNLIQQKLLPQGGLRSLLNLPTAEKVKQLSIVTSLVYMMTLDIMRPFRIAAVRRGALGWGEKFSTFGGLLKTRHYALENAIATAREEASLAKRILFLSRSQQVFHLWHVVHKPFSYTFALLAIIHIVVVSMMGYF